MTFQLIKFALFLWVATCLTQAVKAPHPPADYLSMYLPETNLKEIVLILDQIEQNGDGSATETLEYLKTLKNQLENQNSPDHPALNDLDNSSTHRLRLIWVIDNLLLLTNSEKHKPLPDEIKQTLMIINLAYGNVESLNGLLQEPQTVNVKHPKLLKYLQVYGLTYLRGCFEHYVERDQKKTIFNSLDATSEVEFDRVYRTLEGSDNNMMSIETGDIRLVQLVKDLDLMNSKFNAKKMLKAMKKETTYSDNHDAGEKIFYNFFETNCARLRSSMGPAFDIYNLTRALIPDLSKETFSPRFQKLNEYSRICLPIQNPQLRDEAIKNIKANLNNVWYKKALRNLSAFSP